MLVCCLVCWVLPGCSYRAVDDQVYEVTGKVDAGFYIDRPMYLSLRLYSVVDGRRVRIAQQDYQVSNLPLRFTFKLRSAQAIEQGMTLRTALFWSAGGVAQAHSWQSVAVGSEVKADLMPRSCYPACAGAILPVEVH